MAINLDAMTIRRLPLREKPYYVTDEEVPSLQLRVSPNGEKSWSIRYRVGQHQRRLTLGSLKIFSLEKARKHARLEIIKAKTGGDPALQKKAQREAVTVGAFATIYLEKYAKRKKRIASWKSDEQNLTYKILPRWKARAMSSITQAEIVTLLDDIADTAPIQANRIRSLLHTVFNYAIKRGVVSANPVTATDRPGTEISRERCLDASEIRSFWAACDTLDPLLAAYYRLRLATGQRGGEVRAMRWSDVDLDTKVWTIPKEIAKNGREHKVPLNAIAHAIISTVRASVEARRIEGDPPVDASRYVLEGVRRTTQREAASAAFAILPDFRGHDLRRTCATHMAEHGVAQQVLSKILNHSKKSDVTNVYNRFPYEQEKRAALELWSRVLTGILEDRKTSSVVAFAKK